MSILSDVKTRNNEKLIKVSILNSKCGGSLAVCGGCSLEDTAKHSEHIDEVNLSDVLSSPTCIQPSSFFFFFNGHDFRYVFYFLSISNTYSNLEIVTFLFFTF